MRAPFINGAESGAKVGAATRAETAQGRTRAVAFPIVRKWLRSEAIGSFHSSLGPDRPAGAFEVRTSCHTAIRLASCRRIAGSHHRGRVTRGPYRAALRGLVRLRRADLGRSGSVSLPPTRPYEPAGRRDGVRHPRVGVRVVDVRASGRREACKRRQRLQSTDIPCAIPFAPLQDSSSQRPSYRWPSARWIGLASRSARHRRRSSWSST